MIEWRRNMVITYLAKGWSQTEIAKELTIHPSTISLDVQWLKEKAQKELETHIESKIPLEYIRAMTGLNNILKKANETLEKVTDTKTQLQTMALLADLYKSIMTLTTDGGIVQQAMKIVKGFEREDISKVKMSSEEEDEDVDEEDLEDEEEEITVNDEDEILNEEEEEDSRKEQ